MINMIETFDSTTNNMSQENKHKRTIDSSHNTNKMNKMDLIKVNYLN